MIVFFVGLLWIALSFLFALCLKNLEYEKWSFIHLSRFRLEPHLSKLRHRIFSVLFEKRRRDKQVDDFIILIRQILYFRHLPINLHTKIRKCVPVVNTIQRELMKLVTEWYEEPEQAIQMFRLRLNNEHADGLCDTLISIFQYEHEEYYKHLESRMNDLKLIQKQAKEAKKETRSYLFFVLSGIPLIHSFQVFIYPWLIEGTTLFQTIN